MATPAPTHIQDDSRSLSAIEQSEFEEQLNLKNLRELLEWQRQIREEADREVAALKAVKQGNLSALDPYIQPQMKGAVMLNAEDTRRERAAIAEGHLRNEKTVWDIKEGRDPTQALEKAKKWLKDAFPTLHTEALLVKDTQGRPYIAVLGVSGEEVDAVGRLKSKTREAEIKTHKISVRVEETIKQAQQTTASADHEAVAPPRTPNPRNEPPHSVGKAFS